MSNSELKEEQINFGNICLGIDFGNSKISGAIFNQNKRHVEIVKNTDSLNQFPAVLNLGADTPISDNNLGEIHYYDKEGNEEFVQPKENIEINNEDKKNIIGDQKVGVYLPKEYTAENLDTYIYDIKKIIGQQIIEEMQYELIKKNITYNIKLDQSGRINIKLGHSEEAEDNNGNSETNERSMEDLATFLIYKIKSLAEQQCGGEKVNTCTISVPHYFDVFQQTSLRIAANNAGIENVFIIVDPLSTALYYISKNKVQKNENFLIIDFGSSKLDITLLNINEKNIIKIVSSGGDSHFGGDKFNELLLKEVIDTYESEGGYINKDDIKKMFILKEEVERVKKELTFKPEANITLQKFDDKKDLVFNIKRNDFDEINKQVYKAITSMINDLLEENGFKTCDDLENCNSDTRKSNKENQNELKKIDHVILQGDSIRVLELTRQIEEMFSDTDVIKDLYDSVAYGAALNTAKKMQVFTSERYKNFKIYDTTPLSIGIRVEGDLYSVILPRGSKVPIRVTKTFVTTQDKQNKVKIEIFEGERRLVSCNQPLEKMILRDLTENDKGKVKIRVILTVDEDMKLTIEAGEDNINNSKNKKSCKSISKSFQINCFQQDRINELIDEAYKNLEQDLMEEERIKSMLNLNNAVIEFIHIFTGDEDIRRELENYKNWIKHSEKATKEEFDNKLKELIEKMKKYKNKGNGNNYTITKKVENNGSSNSKFEEEKNNSSGSNKI